ncbi:Ig-like domain-containing protein [Streptomyces avermitilis]
MAREGLFLSELSARSCHRPGHDCFDAGRDGPRCRVGGAVPRCTKEPSPVTVQDPANNASRPRWARWPKWVDWADASPGRENSRRSVTLPEPVAEDFCPATDRGVETVRRWQDRRVWKAGTIGALAAVVGFASPAAAAVSSTTTVTASPSAASVGASVELTATVTCSADPSRVLLGLTFFDGGDILGEVAVDSGGHAHYTAVFSTAGTHTITAAYNGNANCFASSSMTTVQVSAAPVPPAPPGHGLCRDDCCGLINIHLGGIRNGVDADRVRSSLARWLTPRLPYPVRLQRLTP